MEINVKLKVSGGTGISLIWDDWVSYDIPICPIERMNRPMMIQEDKIKEKPTRLQRNVYRG